MPTEIDTQVKKQVIKEWLSGDSSYRIAADNSIGASSVSIIINEWKRGFEHPHSIRSNNYIKNIGTNPDEIESFNANLANSPEPERLIDVANQVAQLSRSGSITLEFENHVKQRNEEKQRLDVVTRFKKV